MTLISANKRWVFTVVVLLLGTVTGCAVKSGTKTGSVTVVETKIITDKAGNTSFVVQKTKEKAEKSVIDKDSESLLSVQKVAQIGQPYLFHFDVGAKNEIIASIANQDGKEGSDLWLFDNNRKIRLTKTKYFHNQPSLSSDGKLVYFASNKGHKTSNSSYIWRIRKNGKGGMTRIGDGSFEISYPSESPDGKNLLFANREFVDSPRFIWSMGRTGSLPTQIVQGSSPSWVDNETIVFAARVENSGKFGIWTVKSDGSQLTQLITDDEMNLFYPAMDPTGKYLLYVAQKGNKAMSRDIYLFNMEEGLSQQLTTNKSRDDLPKWSHGGKYMYFRSSRGAEWNIWRVDMSNIIQAAGDTTENTE